MIANVIIKGFAVIMILRILKRIYERFCDLGLINLILIVKDIALILFWVAVIMADWGLLF